MYILKAFELATLINTNSYLDILKGSEESLILEEFQNFLVYAYSLEQQGYIYFYMLSSLILTVILLAVAFILSSKDTHFEKISPYECGFEPFGDAHSIFNIQFFIVGILFMLFDLELAFLFPWVINLGILSPFSFFVMLLFLILLIIGFIYEWKKGALDWL